MAVIGPRTIIISPIQGKNSVSRACLSFPSPNPGMNSSLSDSDDSCSEPGPRKRKRLTHLTPEERMQRRKLKNRVAAQTARDRKKMRMTELEEAVAALEAENKRLQSENDSLKHKTRSLSQENSLMKEKLGLNCDGTQSERCDPPESAALNFPLQQEKGHTLRLAAPQYLAFFLTMSLTSLDFCNKLLRAQHQVIKMKTLPHSPTSLPSPVAQQNPPMPWWGPQQQSWNPSKN